MNTLFIDTSSNQEITVGLIRDDKKNLITETIGKQKAQVVLPMIEKVLVKEKVSIKDINAVEVVAGPGSFTGLRVGVAIANALSYSLSIPINKKPIGEFVVPIYE